MRLTLVAGPPCSGKTTYVGEHREPGDLVLDADLLYQALSGGELYERGDGIWDFVWAAFDAVVAEARLHPSKRGTLWIIQGAPKRETRARYRLMNRAQIVVLETPADVCVARARARFGESGRFPEYRRHIDQWWAAYRPDPSDKQPEEGSREQTTRQARA